MVHWPTQEIQRVYLKQHIEAFSKIWPHQYALIEGGCLDELEVSFYPNKKELNKAIREHYGSGLVCGPTFLTQKIPNQKELEKRVYEEEHRTEILLEKLRKNEKSARRCRIKAGLEYRI